MTCGHCGADIVTEDRLPLLRLATADADTKRIASRAAARQFMLATTGSGVLRDPASYRRVEAQFLHDDFPIYCRTFNPRLDPTRARRDGDPVGRGRAEGKGDRD